MSAESRGKPPFAMIAVVLLLTVVAATTGAFVAKKSSGSQVSGEETHKKAKKNHGEPAVTVPIEGLIINLNDPGEIRYLKLSIVLEIDSAEDKTKVEHELHKVKDSVITTASRHTMNQLFTNEGKEALRKELIEAINKQLDEELVKEIYFTEFAIQ
ncbi:MAG: flagellar basal body-associated FliL family protein [Armatimonadota bacterium]